MGVRRVRPLAARFSLLRLVVIVLMVGALAPRLAVAQIENVMREIQARHHYLHPAESLFAWPRCSSDSSTTVKYWPPDGYYDCDVQNGIVSPQAEAAIAAFYGICEDFVVQEFGILEGKDGSSQPPAYEPQDFPFDYPVRSTNYDSVVSQLNQNVAKLRYVGRSLGFADFDANVELSGLVDAIGSIQTETASNHVGTCGEAFIGACNEADDTWQAAWISPASAWPYVMETFSAGRIYCSTSEPRFCAWWGVDTRIHAVRRKLEGNLLNLFGDGTVYISITKPESISNEIWQSHASEPVQSDGKWHSFGSTMAGGSASAPGSWIPNELQPTYVGNLTFTCGDTSSTCPEGASTDCNISNDFCTYGIGLQAGWILQGAFWIVQPNWEYGATEASCDCAQDESDLLRNPNVARNFSSSKSDDNPDSPMQCGAGGGKHKQLKKGGRNGSPGGNVGANPKGPGASDDVPDFEMPEYSVWIPVDLRTGHKLESDVDVSVALREGDFTISRSYSSDPGLGGAGLVGANWTLSAFSFLQFDGSDVYLNGASLDSATVFTETASDSGVWVTNGASTLKIERKDNQPIGGQNQTFNVFRMSEPGAWEADYLNAPSDPKHGMLLEERDVYGGKHTYFYAVHGPSSSEKVRLAKIELNASGRTTGKDAVIMFNWQRYAEASNSTIPDDVTYRLGNLNSIEVFRFDENGQEVLTDQVEYTYFKNLGSGFSGGYPTSVGSLGDLVQVVKRKVMERAPAAYSPPQSQRTAPNMRTRITQYRYYRTNGSGSGDERLAGNGVNHQLKMLISPEQIEYAAEKAVLNGAISGAPSYSESTAATYVEDFANFMLTLSDSDYAFCDSLPPPSSNCTGDVRIVDLAAKVVDYLPAGNGAKVEKEFVQTGCTCSGASQGLKVDFASYAWTGGSTTVVAEYKKCTGGPNCLNGWELHRTTYHDFGVRRTGYLPDKLTKAIVEPSTAGGRQWVSHWSYDSVGNLVRAMSPSARSSYSPSTGAEVAPSYAASTTAGVVHAIAYTSDNRVKEVRIGNGDKSNSSNVNDLSGFTLLVQIDYPSQDGSGVRKYLPTAVRHYRTEVTNPSAPAAADIEETTFAYGFHGSATASDKLAWYRRSAEAELQAENGPDSTQTYDRFVLFDDKGFVRWERGEDFSLTYYQYDAATGRATILVRNADPAAPISGGATLSTINVGLPSLSTTDWGNNPVTHARLAGGDLTYTYQYDSQGRQIASTGPDGVSHYTVRELQWWTRAWESSYSLSQAILREAETTYPFKVSNSPLLFDGTATIVWRNAGGRALRTSEYLIVNPGEGAWDPARRRFPDVIGISPDAPTNTYEVARSTSTYVLNGSISETRQWPVLQLALFSSTPDYAVCGFSNFTTYEYDALGRTEVVVSAVGTRTRNTFDVLGRVIEVNVSTIPKCTTGSATSEKVVAKYFYDTSTSGSQGMGDGVLSFVQQFTGDSSSSGLAADQRETRYIYDWRNRLTETRPPAAPYEVRTYDILGRVVERGLFGSVPSSGISSSDRGLYTKTFYSQRGLEYKQQVAINPGNLNDGYLETNTWFDPDGRVIAQWKPNSPASKVAYDGLGRSVTTWITDRGGDAAPGASGNYAAAASVSGDIVLEQTESTYRQAAPWKGRLALTTSRSRIHDATSSDTGSLTLSTAVSTFVGFYYDEASRLIRTVNYGTSSASTTHPFEKGTSAPSWPPSTVPEWNNSSFANAIVSATYYDDQGRVLDLVDGEGKITRSLYDSLGRQIAVFENFSRTVYYPSPYYNYNYVIWDANWNSGMGGWVPYYPFQTSQPADQDRLTTYAYDGAGRVVLQVAHTPNSANVSAVQATQYVYGVTAGSVGTFTNSLVDSKDLLAEVRYPDESSGMPGATNALKVRYSYNAAGELRSVIDQNGTTHVYYRDVLGRVTTDKVTSFGSGSSTEVCSETPPSEPWSIDTTIGKIGVVYDALGRVQDVDSYKGSGYTTIANAVRFRYTSLWQIAHVYQDHDSDIELSTPSNLDSAPSGNSVRVTYGYSTSLATSSNYSRPKTLTYPSGVVEHMDYGATSSLHDRISRLTKLWAHMPDSGTGYDVDLAEYTYLGLATPIMVDYPHIDVQLDRTLDSVGNRRTFNYTGTPSGTYPSMDQFGRVTHHAWVDGSLTKQNTQSVAHLSGPQIVAEAYTYDRASNRTGKYDERPGAHLADRDYQYSYDGLHRLKEARRGSGMNTQWTLAHGSQKWALDVLGNWLELRRDLTGSANNGDPSYTDTGDGLDARTHNSANEIGCRTIDGGTPSLPFTYDDSGNLRTMKRTGGAKRAYIHDAWNRLVNVQDSGTGPNNSTWLAPLAANEYNGLHWRTTSNTGLAAFPAQRRRYYYSPAWQVLEEIVEQDEEEVGYTFAKRVEHFWGVRYIDDSIGKHEGWADPGSEPFPAWSFTLSDVQFSVVAVLDENAVLRERVSYDPYGVGKHRWLADVDGDGDVDMDDIDRLWDHDQGTIADPNAAPGYWADADLDRDGVVDIFSEFALIDNFKSALAPEKISDPDGPDNDVGYCGYMFDWPTRMYAVRFRWYVPELGRWVERDPAGYVDGMNVLAYALSSPTAWMDPFGLSPDDDNKEYHRLIRIRDKSGEYLKSHDPEQYASLLAKIEELNAKIQGAAMASQNAECGCSIKDGMDYLSGGKMSENWKKVLQEAKDGLKANYGPFAAFTIFIGGRLYHGDDAIAIILKNAERLDSRGMPWIARQVESHAAGAKHRGPSTFWKIDGKKSTENITEQGLKRLKELLEDKNACVTQLGRHREIRNSSGHGVVIDEHGNPIRLLEPEPGKKP